MGRNRFVQAGIVRLELSDVYKRRLEEFKTKGVRLPAKKDAQGVGLPADPAYRQATDKELADAQSDLDVAVIDAAWVEVKSELTAGEARDANNQMFKTMYYGERAEVDPLKVGFTKIMAYVTGWSLEDHKGPVPLDANSLSNVDTDTYAEIERAIDWHDEQVVAAREARKNEMAGLTKSSETLVSAG